MRSIDLNQRDALLTGLGAVARIALVAGIVALAIASPLIGAGAVYVLVFMLISFRRPDIAIMLVFAAAPFQTDMSEGGSVKFSMAEINLGLTFLALLLKRIVDHKPIHYGPTFLPVLLYFGVCAVATMHNFSGSEAVVAYVQMFLYMVVAVIVFSQFVPRAESCELALKGGMAVCVFLAVAQMIHPGEFVFGLQKNGIGSSLSCGLVIAVDYWFNARDVKRKKIITAALIIIAAGLICTLSRGAWLAAVAGCGVLTIMRGKYTLFLRGMVVAVIIFFVVWTRLPDQEQSYTVNFDTSRDNISRRIDTIDQTKTLFQQSPIIGNGIGLRKQMDATNLVWMSLAESGVLGLASFLLLNASFFVTFWKGYKLVPPHSIEASLYAIGNALLVAHFAHGLVDHYWSRGAIMMVWGATGMAMGVYLRTHRPRRKNPALVFAGRRELV